LKTTVLRKKSTNRKLRHQCNSYNSTARTTTMSTARLHIDAEGNESNTTTDTIRDDYPARSINDTNATTLQDTEDTDALPLQKKYPIYGWNHTGEQRNDHLQITLPCGEDPTIFGRTSITSATLPILAGTDGEEAEKIEKKRPVRFMIPSRWWKACVWWLGQCLWARIGLGIGTEKNAHIATWMEMTIAFQIQTGIRLAPSILDMRSQEHAFRRMVRAMWSKSKFMQGGTFVTCEQAWKFKPYILSVAPVIGHSRAGICRRPMLCNEVWNGDSASM